MKRKTKNLFPAIEGEDQFAAFKKQAIARELESEMSRTLSVDSVATILVADFAYPLGFRLSSEYHVARSVQRGKKRHEVLWTRYEERWVELRNGWHLTRVDNRGLGHVSAAAAAGALLRVRPADSTPHETRRTFRPPSDDQVLSARDIPGDLTAGDRIGPFSLPCKAADGGFVYYEKEPKPISMGGGARLVDEREDATAVLHVFVCETGQVGWIKVSEGGPPSCAAAVAAVSGWRYTPATSNEKPVAVWIEVAVEVR